MRSLKIVALRAFVHIDFNSFTEPETASFCIRVDEIEEKYRQNGSHEASC